MAVNLIDVQLHLCLLCRLPGSSISRGGKLLGGGGLMADFVTKVKAMITKLWNTAAVE